MPSITWDADPGMNHTLIFWDSGALMLRGLYINIEGPVGVSLLSVMGDPYSAELMRKRRIVNYCPVYVSAEFNKLNLSYSVSSVKLSVLVDIVYESPSMELANCCNTTKIIPAKVVRANPIGNGYISAVYTRMEPEVILEQQNLVDPNFFLLSRSIFRCNFNLTKFIVTLNLVIEGASWFSSSLDEDYELKMANDGVMRTMEKVCADVACTPTDPDMPDTTSMPANCPTSYATDNRPSAIMLMVVFAFLRWLM
ncbi:hypothetical protein C0Q70_05162 [Pomacea canaliculata]|uniref:Uncharacterized protein n=1 Tax=Pomacea canaliculata TaxID=400727 RepID=A0A2T7PKG8_POMCA|nr:hypothetical protein C0Q70_05162 [Pomacea canaliculata]